MSHRGYPSIEAIAALVLLTSSWFVPVNTVCGQPAPTSKPGIETPVDAAVPPVQVTPTTANETAADKSAIEELADKIVATLTIADAAQAARIRSLIANQYRALHEIHKALAAKTAEATKTPGADPTIVNAWTAVARVHTSVKLLQLHRYFLARLAVELTPEQVDKVKDGMTDGAVQVAYRHYLEILPELTDDQKREVLANLLEAREYAMDAGSSDEKQQIFDKYKVRINSYLSRAGHNLQQAKRNTATRQAPARGDAK